jgi:hypothetical protein
LALGGAGQSLKEANERGPGCPAAFGHLDEFEFDPADAAGDPPEDRSHVRRFAALLPKQGVLPDVVEAQQFLAAFDVIQNRFHRLDHASLSTPRHDM